MVFTKWARSWDAGRCGLDSIILSSHKLYPKYALFIQHCRGEESAYSVSQSPTCKKTSNCIDL